MLSYFNQWGSLGPLMVKTVSTLHGDTRCVRHSSCFKCILNLEFWESHDFVSISSTIFINAKYNVTLLLQCGFLFFSSVFLLASSFWMLLFACLQFVLLCSRLAFLKQSFNAFGGWIWCIGGVVRSWASSWFQCLPELQYWVLSVLLNPSLSRGVLHRESMLSWSKVMYRCLQHLRDRLLALGQCADHIPCLLPVIDKLWHGGPCSIS